MSKREPRGSEGLVSVVIPTYNYASHVCDAVESALRQTYAEIEVIVVDDGSTDDTRSRLRRYGDRIIYHYQENGGLASARNKGISLAQGEWVAFLDSDDVWHTDKLRVQLGVIDDEDICLVGSPAATALEESLSSDPEVYRLSVFDFLTTTPFGPSGAVARRRSLLEVNLFDQEMPGCGAEDRDLWLRLASRYSVLFVSSPCWWYRQHEGQMNRNAESMFRNLHWVMAKFAQENPEYQHLMAEAWAFAYSDAAVCYYESGRRLHALRLMATSFCCQPRPLTQATCLFPVHSRAKLSVKLVIGDRLMGKLCGIRDRWLPPRDVGKLNVS